MPSNWVRAEQSGLAKKPYSARLGLIGITSTLISGLSASILAYDFLGYHVPDRPPHPDISALGLVFGLSLAIVGQLLGSGRNEGIRARGWVGIIDVLLIRLAFASLMFMSVVFKYAIRGMPIPLYPVGVLTIVGGFFLACRLFTKFVFHIDSKKRSQLSSATLCAVNSIGGAPVRCRSNRQSQT